MNVFLRLLVTLFMAALCSSGANALVGPEVHQLVTASKSAQACSRVLPQTGAGISTTVSSVGKEVVQSSMRGQQAIAAAKVDPKKIETALYRKITNHSIAGLSGRTALQQLRNNTSLQTEPVKKEAKLQRTLVLIKPDAIEQRISGVIQNCVHASGAPDEAEVEIALWFKPGEVLDF